MKLFALLLLLPLHAGLAGLTWSTTHFSAKATQADKEVVARFSFKNDTTKPLTITHLESSCGCTVPQLAKKTYAPGETGEIVAYFTIGQRMGMQNSTIQVATSDAPRKPTALRLQIDIPDPLETSPLLLTWKRGGEAKDQVFTVKAKPGFSVKIAEISVSNQQFTAEIATAKEGSRYDIAVRPKNTAQIGFGLLIITTDYPAKEPRVIYAQLKVE